MAYVGYGANRPIADNSARGRMLNRRTEIIILDERKRISAARWKICPASLMGWWNWANACSTDLYFTPAARCGRPESTLTECPLCQTACPPDAPFCPKCGHAWQFCHPAATRRC